MQCCSMWTLLLHWIDFKFIRDSSNARSGLMITRLKVFREKLSLWVTVLSVKSWFHGCLLTSVFLSCLFADSECEEILWAGGGQIEAFFGEGGTVSKTEEGSWRTQEVDGELWSLTVERMYRPCALPSIFTVKVASNETLCPQLD